MLLFSFQWNKLKKYSITTILQVYMQFVQQGCSHWKYNYYSVVNQSLKQFKTDTKSAMRRWLSTVFYLTDVIFYLWAFYRLTIRFFLNTVKSQCFCSISMFEKFRKQSGCLPNGRSMTASLNPWDIESLDILNGCQGCWAGLDKPTNLSMSLGSGPAWSLGGSSV